VICKGCCSALPEMSTRGTVPLHLEQDVRRQIEDCTGEKGIEQPLIFSILPSSEMRQESSGEKILGSDAE